MKTNTKTIISFIAIILGFFMALLDATIVNIALEKMTIYYNVSMEHISWVVNGYNLAFAVFIITASRLADQFGRKKLFMIGVFIFTLSSFMAGISTNVDMLIFFRLVQGLSGAIVVPVTIPMVVEIFPKEKQGAILGIWGAIAGLAAASGPALGGILTQNFNWQSIFFVNIPLGFITLFMVGFLIKESYDSTASKKIDWGGMISLSIVMFALTYALIRASDLGWTSPTMLGLFALSAVSLLVFVVIEIKAKEPMLPMWLLKIGPFNGASLALFVFGAGMMGAMFMISIFLQRVMGLSILQAGLTVSSMPLASIIFSAITGPLSNKLGSRWFAMFGIGLISLALFLCSGLNADSTRIDAIWRLLLVGAGMGCTMTPIMGSAIRNVPKEKVGIVSGVTNMARALGGVLGIAILVTVMTVHGNSEGIKAKNNIIRIIQSDTVLDTKLKNQAIKKIQLTKISDSAKLSKPDQIINQLNLQEKADIAKYPNAAKKIHILYKRQKQEVWKIWPSIQKSTKNATSKAFSFTFKFGSIMILIGILFAFFSDKRGRPDKDTEMSIVFEV